MLKVVFSDFKMDTTNTQTIKEQEDVLLTPLQDPSLPLRSPPSVTSEMAIRLQILALTEQLETLEGIIKSDCAIGISGLSNLRNPENTNYWQDRVHGLLYDCEIPFPWFFEILPTECGSSDEDIEIAYIYFINELTKEESKKRINRFLNSNYSNQVAIV